ncbi:MAG: proline dehydrogenase family protein, partial [Bdellovibrionales bacterium]|nr:proline dehydrogenase family protein [Bdellovibrionales bacterium]
MKTAIDESALDRAIQELGTSLFEETSQGTLSVFDPQFYAGKLLDWAMKDEAFKVSLFRFVDVLPALRSSESVISHAQEYFASAKHHIPALLRWGLDLNPASIRAKVAAQLIRQNVKSMAEQFIIGATPKEALGKLRAIRKQRMAFTVDLLGEATVSEHEAEDYLRRYYELLDTLSREATGWAEAKPLLPDHPGEATVVNVSVKLSALYSQIQDVATEHAIEQLTPRLRDLMLHARKLGAYVYVDMEDSSLTSITIETFRRAVCDPALRDWENCGIVIQAYLRRTESDIRDILGWVRERGARIGMRLVKGAYWDSETALAEQHGWEPPVWQRKSETDWNYEHLSRLVLQHSDLIRPAFASHNIRSLAHAICYADQIGLDARGYELQMLYGMADPIKEAFVKRQYLVRQYAPIGELIPGMGYLVRRLLENTSNEGFLRQGFHEHLAATQLLKAPTPPAERPAMEVNSGEFHNISPTDFTEPERRAAYREAIRTFIHELREQPRRVLPIVGGKSIETAEFLPTVCPEDPEVTLATISLADRKLARTAVSDLQRYAPTWANTSVEERAVILERAAELMVTRWNELAALVVLECGKQWREADYELVEAVDFLRFYAQAARELFRPKELGTFSGERNLLLHEPRGVTAVISPWNFPLAIPCGMMSAALVCGNPVAFKPAEQSSLIASRLFQILLEAGLPYEAAAFLPGWGEDVGRELVDAPEVATIAFTGSSAVGLEIIKAAATVRPGQVHVKRAITEMGGKNAIIIDDDADLDEAVAAVISSAFGYAGQKCSACSRVVVLEANYDRFVARLKEATESLRVG